MSQSEASIMIAVDLGPATAAVVAAGRELARVLGAHAWLIFVAEPDPAFVGLEAGPASVRTQLARHFHEEHLALQALAQSLREDGLEATALLVQGQAGAKIPAEAAHLKARYLVLGAHCRSAATLFSGNVLDQVVRRAPCPVLVVPPAGAA